MDLHSYRANGPDKDRRQALPATCQLHRGPIGFANLLVSMQGRTLVFDPHVAGKSLIALEEQDAMKLYDTLTEWLGRTPDGPDGPERGGDGRWGYPAGGRG